MSWERLGVQRVICMINHKSEICFHTLLLLELHDSFVAIGTRPLLHRSPAHAESSASMVGTRPSTTLAATSISRHSFGDQCHGYTMNDKSEACFHTLLILAQRSTSLG